MPQNLVLRTATLAASGCAMVLAAAGSAAAAPLFDFESAPIVQNTPYTIMSDGLNATFSGPASEPDAFAISFNSASGPFPAPYAGLVGAFLGTALTALDPSDPLTISFSAPVTSVSLRFGLGGRTGALSYTTNTGVSSLVAGAVPTGFAYAEGLLSYSGAAFTSLTLRTDAAGLAIDNVAVTTAATAVPEPATAALLGAGLAGIAGLRRRTRA